MTPEEWFEHPEFDPGHDMIQYLIYTLENAKLSIPNGAIYFQELIEQVKASDHYIPPYDPEFGDRKLCECGDEYYRHFDSYEDMYPIGCKYCQCLKFKLAEEES